jgi:hypothetical protein
MVSSESTTSLSSLDAWSARGEGRDPFSEKEMAHYQLSGKEETHSSKGFPDLENFFFHETISNENSY